MVALLMFELLMVALLIRDVKKCIWIITDEYDHVINDRVINVRKIKNTSQQLLMNMIALLMVALLIGDIKNAYE